MQKCNYNLLVKISCQSHFNLFSLCHPSIFLLMVHKYKRINLIIKHLDLNWLQVILVYNSSLSCPSERREDDPSSLSAPYCQYIYDATSFKNRLMRLVSTVYTVLVKVIMLYYVIDKNPDLGCCSIKCTTYFEHWTDSQVSWTIHTTMHHNISPLPLHLTVRCASWENRP